MDLMKELERLHAGELTEEQEIAVLEELKRTELERHARSAGSACPKCGCYWGAMLRQVGDRCNDALYKFGAPDEDCDGILISADTPTYCAMCLHTYATGDMTPVKTSPVLTDRHVVRVCRACADHLRGVRRRRTASEGI